MKGAGNVACGTSFVKADKILDVLRKALLNYDLIMRIKETREIFVIK